MKNTDKDSVLKEADKQRAALFMPDWPDGRVALTDRVADIMDASDPVLRLFFNKRASGDYYFGHVSVRLFLSLRHNIIFYIVWHKDKPYPAPTKELRELGIVVLDHRIPLESDGYECWLETIRDRVNEEIMAWNEEK